MSTFSLKMKKVAWYVLAAMVGVIVGSYFGSIYGKNYGFNFPFFSPGYQRAAVVGFWLGLVLLLSSSIVFQIKKIKRYWVGIGGFAIGSLVANYFFYKVVELNWPWYLALAIIIILPIIGFIVALLISKKC